MAVEEGRRPGFRRTKVSGLSRERSNRVCRETPALHASRVPAQRRAAPHQLAPPSTTRLRTSTAPQRLESERKPGGTRLPRLTTHALRDHRTRRLSSIAMRSGGCFDGSRYSQTMKRQAPMNSEPAQSAM